LPIVTCCHAFLRYGGNNEADKGRSTTKGETSSE